MCGVLSSEQWGGEGTAGANDGFMSRDQDRFSKAPGTCSLQRVASFPPPAPPGTHLTPLLIFHPGPARLAQQGCFQLAGDRMEPGLGLE